MPVPFPFLRVIVSWWEAATVGVGKVAGQEAATAAAARVVAREAAKAAAARGQRPPVQKRWEKQRPRP